MAHRWHRFWFWASHKREFHEITVGIWPLYSDEIVESTFAKFKAAFDLLSTYAPNVLEQIVRDVHCVLVAGNISSHAMFIRELRMVEFDSEDVVAEDTTPEHLACTLVHEAQHGRLFRLGFGYEPERRGKIERICFRAQRNFANRLPNGHDLVSCAEQWMAVEPHEYYSNEARNAAKLRALRELQIPRIIPDLLEQLIRWRTERTSKATKSIANKPIGPKGK